MRTVLYPSESPISAWRDCGDHRLVKHSPTMHAPCHHKESGLCLLLSAITHGQYTDGRLILLNTSDDRTILV